MAVTLIQYNFMGTLYHQIQHIHIHVQYKVIKFQRLSQTEVGERDIYLANRHLE